MARSKSRKFLDVQKLKLLVEVPRSSRTLTRTVPTQCGFAEEDNLHKKRLDYSMWWNIMRFLGFVDRLVM
jgi:hypothetical protein